jgi:hypothetical protein
VPKRKDQRERSQRGPGFTSSERTT